MHNLPQLWILDARGSSPHRQHYLDIRIEQTLPQPSMPHHSRRSKNQTLHRSIIPFPSRTILSGSCGTDTPVGLPLTLIFGGSLSEPTFALIGSEIPRRCHSDRSRSAGDGEMEEPAVCPRPHGNS